MIKKVLFYTTGILIILLVSLVAILNLRYGGGEPFADRSTAPILPSSALEVVTALEEPPGNIADVSFIRKSPALVIYSLKSKQPDVSSKEIHRSCPRIISYEPGMLVPWFALV